MKIIITGSLGHISKPLAKELVQKGHSVTVISSNPHKQNDIEAIGATVAIGSIEDISFLAKTFTGADAVYTMLPPFKFQENPNLDAREEARRLTGNYVAAIQQSGVKKVVHLSSIGAHTDKGNGLLAFHFVAEQVMKQLPADVTVTFMRPVGFYYNLYQFMDIVKGEGFLKGFVGLFLTLRHYGLTGLLQGKRGLIVSNYGAEDKMPWVSPIDIAAAISGKGNGIRPFCLYRLSMPFVFPTSLLENKFTVYSYIPIRGFIYAIPWKLAIIDPFIYPFLYLEVF